MLGLQTLNKHTFRHPIIDKFIQWAILILIAVNGAFLIIPVVKHALPFFQQNFNSFISWKETLATFDLFEIPQFVLGVGLVLSSIGLAMRVRIAWFFSLILLFCTCVFVFLSTVQSNWIVAFSLGLMLMLVLYRKFYNQSSIIAGSCFALLSLILLLFYSVFGCLHMGSQFKPELTDFSSATYFSLVTMSTVGYGDIVPSTADARLFTLSIIMFGITFFAASISGVASSLVGGGLKRIIHGRRYHKMRKNHYIIIGVSPLALSLFKGLEERNIAVTIIVSQNSSHAYPETADLITGDPSDTKCLLDAGADEAQYVLALRDDDADNAFTVLAAKEVVNKNTKIISLVNSSNNLQKIKRVEPDMLFSLQILGSELLIRTLNNDTIDNKLVTDLFFGNLGSEVLSGM